ncbi:MAG: 4-hydroxy-tetrahydrodipicolinate reductase [Endomicrobium sp.]|jgi:4-hydroxy-tetrahydrodipicolinate reductase|nr:4-hydroxy-tetrahydrodipicolinate reductase [Endomicrobium sp.]
MKIIICGAAGKMGQAIITMAKSDDDVEILGTMECDGNKAVGSGDPIILSISDLEKFLFEADVIIDFTNPESSLENLEMAKKHNTPIVIGTTGFIESQKRKITEISRNVPVVFSPNMSIGINILFKLIEDITKIIPDYDVEVVELHHNKKKDSPSGTAEKLAEVVALSRGKNINDVVVYGRHFLNKTRKKDEIGVLSVRAGDIVGDHTVYFAGLGDRIELTHRAHSRSAFAAGAIRAAKWISNQKPGLYDMSDVLSLKQAIDNTK